MKDSGVEWIGEIPAPVKLLKAKYLFSFQKGKLPSSVNNDGQGLPCIGASEMNGAAPTVFTSDNLPTCKETDVLLLWDGANAGLVSSGHSGIVSSTVCRVRLISDSCTPRFAYYSLKNAERYYREKVGGTTIPHMNSAYIDDTFIIAFDLSEQQRIANYLDSKCAAIDDVITKTTESIEEYKKLKQAVITEAVTRGVRGKRPMKDSGIDWIGQVPCDWNLQRIKTLFDLRTELNFKPLEEVNLISLYTDKGVVQHVDLEKTTGNKAMNADGYKVVYENDIVVNIILCWMGAIGRSAYNGVTSPAYDVYCPKNGAESRFYHYYFRTAGFNGECFTRGRGIMLMRWRTYSDQFRDIRVVVPPLSEQKEIVKFLDSKCAAIDTLISKKQQFIAELTAYKKSLIYEYVTGKKEVSA